MLLWIPYSPIAVTEDSDLDRSPHVQMKFVGDMPVLEARLSGHKINTISTTCWFPLLVSKTLTEEISKLKNPKN